MEKLCRSEGETISYGGNMRYKDFGPCVVLPCKETNWIYLLKKRSIVYQQTAFVFVLKSSILSIYFGIFQKNILDKLIFMDLYTRMLMKI